MQAERQGALVGYFGYGSLVNRGTHRTKIEAAYPARLNGWRRAWCPRPALSPDSLEDLVLSLLTVRRDPAAFTDGLLVVDRAENLAAVDLREQRYDRRLLAPHDITLLADRLPDDLPLYVYEARAPASGRTVACPIYQSYLDAVMQGFLTEHGEAGLRAFVFDTDGFDVPVLADRDRPLYPRAVMLAEAERILIDALLAERRIAYRST